MGILSFILLSHAEADDGSFSPQPDFLFHESIPFDVVDCMVGAVPLLCDIVVVVNGGAGAEFRHIPPVANHCSQVKHLQERLDLVFMEPLLDFLVVTEEFVGRVLE